MRFQAAAFTHLFHRVVTPFRLLRTYTSSEAR